MKNDPFLGLEQRLFNADKSASQPADKPASSEVAQPTRHSSRKPHTKEANPPAVIPATETATHPTEVAAVQPVIQTDNRVIEKHTYDIYEDQARWMNRLKLDLEERYRAELTSNGIVQLAIDALREDFQQRGEASRLFRSLVTEVGSRKVRS